MHPILVKIGPITIYSYGFFIASAVLLALAITSREAKKRGLNHVLTSELGFYVLVGGFIGARLFYILICWDYFLKHPLEMFMFWKGGLVFLGGAIGGAISSFWFFKRYQQPFWPWADCVAPGIAMGQAVGRMGCLCAGCCYGKPTTVPWAITFTNPKSLAPLYVPLHPTQIYHSLAGLITFIILMLARKKLNTGQMFGLFLVLYAIFRFNIEFFRGDYRGWIGPLSATQVVAFFVFWIGLIILWHRRKSRRGA
ncbi:MAG: prolipoprotein diacylglyceryl transferase [Desulfonauticus sp.]|nr:prolipoprotein diacylglyceryl transferase [Desulfonauticus sp.]